MLLLRLAAALLRSLFLPRATLPFREPCPPPSTECPTADGDATTPEGSRPAVLGLAFPNLVKLAFLPRHRQASDRHPVAPPGLSTLLAMAVPTEASRAAEIRPRDSRSDPSDVHREPDMGKPSNPR
jgi:hypothetical protein